MSLGLSLVACCLKGADAWDEMLPVRGFCIAAPRPSEVDRMIAFIREELAPRHFNTLVLRVDSNFQYTSHPDLADPGGLSRAEVRKLVAACAEHQIRIVPQFNLLGHQSWAERLGKLLQQHPEFDETPAVKLPEHYRWPNPDGLYCKSYCPLHPQVHGVVLALVDELCAAFEARDFHAGMDEVFYLGDDRCPRCRGKDRAELFAGEVSVIRNHLSKKGVQLWIWGDRLLEGRISGLGEWEASFNHTERAVDLIPKDVMICDWHYERPEPTPPYFALKGHPW